MQYRGGRKICSFSCARDRLPFVKKLIHLFDQNFYFFTNRLTRHLRELPSRHLQSVRPPEAVRCAPRSAPSTAVCLSGGTPSIILYSVSHALRAFYCELSINRGLVRFASIVRRNVCITHREIGCAPLSHADLTSRTRKV